MTVSDLVGSAGGLLRSANPEGGDLTHYAISNSSGERVPAGHQDLNLAAALAGKEEQNLPLRDGDVLTVPQQASWNDIGASVTLRGEVRKPGVYGIRPGERLSSLLQRAGGLLPTAYPRAAVFERIEVRELQEKSRQELIERLEQESTVVKTSASTSGTEEAALQQAAVQQRQRVLEGLRKATVSGRLVIHLRPDRKNFAQSPEDIELRAGDSLTIPKQPGAVLVIGQVYNANALVYSPGKNAGWYFSLDRAFDLAAACALDFPVMTDPRKLRGGNLGMAIVALAGPVSNLIFAGVIAVLANFLPNAADILFQAVFLSIYLALFNLIPLPPLDGSKVLLAAGFPVRCTSNSGATDSCC